MKKYSAKAFLFFVTLIMVIKASAFRLEPMVANFTVGGDGASKIFRVENEGKERIAVKIYAVLRQIDENGKESLVETKDFKIYPEQVSLAASDSRAVRVVYIGPKDIEQEVAYRIVAAQLPVAFKDEGKKSGVKFLYEFKASVYATNEKYIPKIEVESITRIDKDQIKVKIINKGQKHTLLKFVKIELKDTSGKTLKLDGNLIKNWDGENILSGTRRTFILKSAVNFDLQKNPPQIEVQDEI